MATLSSAGSLVTIVDESVFASAGAGTIPLIIMATRTNKADPTLSEPDGIAKFTKKEFANRLTLVTSQRELAQFFGNAVFKKDGVNIVEAAETSEYGLHAAHSYLGQGSRVYVLRADVDLGQLEPEFDAPVGPVSAGSWWLDTSDTVYGIHEWNGTAWIRQTPVVEIVSDASPVEIAGTYVPTATGSAGDYLVAVMFDGTAMAIYYFKHDGTDWAAIDATFAPHFSAPVTPANGDAWVKTTSRGNGLDLSLFRANSDGEMIAVTVEGVTFPVATSTYIPQDGSAIDTIATLTNTASQITVNAGETGFLIKTTAANAPVDLGTNDKYAQNIEPTGNPVDGTLWASANQTDLDILIRDVAGWSRIDAAQIQYATDAPTTNSVGGALASGDIWVNTRTLDEGYPEIYFYNGSEWVRHLNSDQFNQEGVVFADFTDETRDELSDGLITPITGAPNYQLYPAGILAVNLAQSGNTVRVWNSEVGAWRNAVALRPDGSARFGKDARRSAVVQAMQQAVVTNEDVRASRFPFTIMAAPFYPELTDELVALNTDRGETAFIIGDTPMTLNPNEVVQWAQGNGATENNLIGLVTNNTYSAFYYPSGRSTSAEGDTVTVPASHMALYTYAYNDNVAYEWFAPAGLTRGPVRNASTVGYVDRFGEFRPVALNKGQMDSLYTNNINGITNEVGEGPVLFGQKTRHPFASSLDRVNVARLAAYMRRQLEQIVRPFIFEPNDEATRQRLKNVVDSFLGDVLTKRGIYDFVSICDETNNTNIVIDRSELWIDIAIEPAKAAEFIYVPIRLVNTGSLS